MKIVFTCSLEAGLETQRSLIDSMFKVLHNVLKTRLVIEPKNLPSNSSTIGLVVKP